CHPHRCPLRARASVRALMATRGGSLVLAAVVLAWIAVGAGRSAHAAQRAVHLSVSPARVLVDDPVEVRGTGLRPRGNVILELSTRDRVGVAWRSRTTLHVDARGAVDTHASMSPFWSMRPVVKPVATTQFASTRGPLAIAVRLVQGGKTLARAGVMRSTEAAGLVATDTTLGGEGFVGTYYALPSTHPGPALIALDGSGGGHSEL